MNAWLVRWVSASSSAMKRHPIAAVFNAQLTVEKIAEFVESLYAQDSYSFAERVVFARDPGRNPYRAQIYQLNDGTRSYVSCGHNPWLEAHLVQDLMVEADDAEDMEIITWNQVSADGSIYPKRVVQPRT